MTFENTGDYGMSGDMHDTHYGVNMKWLLLASLVGCSEEGPKTYITECAGWLVTEDDTRCVETRTRECNSEGLRCRLLPVGETQ